MTLIGYKYCNPVRGLRGLFYFIVTLKTIKLMRYFVIINFFYHSPSYKISNYTKHLTTGIYTIVVTSFQLPNSDLFTNNK